MIKPALLLLAGIFLAGAVFSCGSASSTKNLLAAPNQIRGEAGGSVLVGEGALGKVWTVDAGDWEIPERPGDDGKKDQLPVLDLGESILEMDLSPDGGTLVLLSESVTGPVLRSYETQGFTEQGKLNLPSPPLDFAVAEEGVVYLLPGDRPGLVEKLPSSLNAAEAVTLAVTPSPTGLLPSPAGGHLLVRYGAGENRFGWLELNGFRQAADIPWAPELSWSGAGRVVFFSSQAEPGGAVMIVPDGQERAYKFSLDQAESAVTVDLLGLTGGMTAGKLSGDPVLIWVTLEGYLHLYNFASGCYGTLGIDASSAGGADFTDVAPVSDPDISKIQTSDCLGVTKTETWTITYTGDGWEVAGTVSGTQPEPAREGEVYTTAGGELSFLISAGENPAGAGDAFTIKTEEGITGKYVGAAAPELYLNETQGLVWIADASGGEILVVDPLTGSTRQIID